MNEARSGDGRRSRALARLTARIADNLASGRPVTFGMRQEYNSLKRKLGLEGRI